MGNFRIGFFGRVLLYSAEKEDDFNEVYAFLIVPAFILSHLLVAFVAFLKKGKLREKLLAIQQKSVYQFLPYTCFYTRFDRRNYTCCFSCGKPFQF